jgi:hypothetical protein
LDVAVPYNINLYLTEQTELLPLIQRLARPCNAAAGVSWTGKLYVTRFGSIPASPTTTFNAQGRRKPVVLDVSEETVSPPFWRIEMLADRSWRVHTLEEVSDVPAVVRGETSPTLSRLGQGWTRPSDGHLFVNVGEITFDGEVILFDGEPLSIPWVKARDGAAVTFDSTGSRNPAPITRPTIASDGSAFEYRLNSDGSCDLTFTWSWVGAEADIDGFEVPVKVGTTSASYQIGTTPLTEKVYQIDRAKRSIILNGVPADRYYTLGVLAWRAVDADIDPARIIRSAVAQSAAAGEMPYQPVSEIMIGGVAVSTLVAGSARKSLSVALTAFGTTAALTVALAPGESASVDAFADVTSISTASNVTLAINHQVNGGGYSVLTSDGPWLGGPGEPVSLSAAGNYGNVSGAPEMVDFTFTLSRTASATATITGFGRA